MSRFVKLLSLAVVLGVCVMGVYAQDAEVVEATTNTVDALSAMGETAIEESNEGISAIDQWTNYLRQGGKTMIFLGILSVLGLGCALERFMNMRLRHVVPEGFSSEIVKLWNSGKMSDVRDLCQNNKSMLARVVETMLEHSTSGDYQEVKMFAEDKAGRELRLENRKASMLATVSTLAPLLGLFGTVVGLLGAFSTVAAVGEMGDPSILADDIGKALVTTVAGLAVAMPALFVYNIIKNRLNLYSILLEEEVSDLVNNLFVKSSR